MEQSRWRERRRRSRPGAAAGSDGRRGRPDARAVGWLLLGLRSSVGAALPSAAPSFISASPPLGTEAEVAPHINGGALFCVGLEMDKTAKPRLDWPEVRKIFWRSLNADEGSPAWTSLFGLALRIVQRWVGEARRRFQVVEEAMVSDARRVLSFGTHKGLQKLPPSRGNDVIFRELGSFCAVGYLSALYVILTRLERNQSHDRRFQLNLGRLCAALTAPNNMHLALFLDLPNWPISTNKILRLLERHGMQSCALHGLKGACDARCSARSCTLSAACRSPGVSGGSSGAHAVVAPPGVLKYARAAGPWPGRRTTVAVSPAAAADAAAALRVAALGSHAYVLEGALASRAAAVAEGLPWEGGVYGLHMHEIYEAGQKTCADLAPLSTFRPDAASSLASSDASSPAPFCRRSAALSATFRRVSSDGVGSAKYSLEEVRAEFQAAFDAEPWLQGAHLLVCGYPMIACLIIGELRGLETKPLLLMVKGAGAASEYADGALVRPWFIRTLREWLAPDKLLPYRRAVVLDSIDVPIVDAAFGQAPEHVPFGALYARALAVEIDCSRRQKTPRRLVTSKPNALFPLPDALAWVTFWMMARSQVLSRIGWDASSLDGQYAYADLQDISAYLLFPWDWALVGFSEFYRLAVPIFLPADTWMHSLISMVYWNKARDKKSWSTTWMNRFSQLVEDYWVGYDFPDASGHPRGNRSRPWISEEAGRASMLERVAEWYAHTEFRRAPYVGRFSSMGDLEYRLHNLDPARTCELMERHNQKVLRRITRFYVGVHQQLEPAVGNSEGTK